MKFIFSGILKVITGNLKEVFIGALIVLVVLLYISNKKNKKDNERNQNNYIEALQENVDIVTTLNLDKQQFEKTINLRFDTLVSQLDSANIQLKKVQRVVVQKFYYKDTTQNKMDLQPIVEAIHKSVKLSVPFIDKTPCLIVRGLLMYNGQSLSLNIQEREFKSINEVVSHIERNQWNLLFFKTRLFGKKEIKVTVFNQCGESKTIIINKTKKNGRKNRL